MSSQITLEMIYNEVKKVNERLTLIEDIIEEIVIKGIPEAKISEKKLEEIKKSIQEMKKGNYITLEELKSA
ncbi:MAG: hypothetical protein ACPLRY_05250 [Candidatus Bathyarchaeales archaeon]